MRIFPLLPTFCGWPPISRIYAGLVSLVRAGTRAFHPSMWLDGAVAGLGVAALGALALDSLIARAEPVGALAVLLAYPAADLVLASLLVGVLAARGWPGSGPGCCWPRAAR